MSDVDNNVINKLIQLIIAGGDCGKSPEFLCKSCPVYNVCVSASVPIGQGYIDLVHAAAINMLMKQPIGEAALLKAFGDLL